MLWDDASPGLDFYDDASLDHEICPVPPHELTVKHNLEGNPPVHRQACLLQQDGQCVGVYSFEEAGSQFGMNSIKGAQDCSRGFTIE